MSESPKYVCSLSCWNFITDLGVYRPFRAFSYNGVIYTVIHPTPVQHLPGYPIVDPHLNLDGRDLRQPLFAANKCPEIAYMVRNFKTENAFFGATTLRSRYCSFGPSRQWFHARIYVSPVSRKVLAFTRELLVAYKRYSLRYSSRAT